MISSISYPQLAEKATIALAKRITRFPSATQSHFASRIYRISGKKKYLPFIKKSMEKKRKNLKIWKPILGNLIKEKEEGKKILARLIKQRPLKKERWQFYQTQPELKLYQRIIFTLKKFQELEITPFLQSREYIKSLQRIREINWHHYLLNPKLIYFDPVQTTNQIFWLKGINVIDLENVFLPRLKKIYPLKPKPHHPKDLFSKNLYYAYTHVIIAASDYYQKFVSPKNYPLIVNFLSQSIPFIIKSKHYDLVAELGVCFKLIKQEEKTIPLKIFLRKNISPQTHLIDYPFKDGKGEEHANILLIMLFKNWPKLYPGPKIKV